MSEITNKMIQADFTLPESSQHRLQGQGQGPASEQRARRRKRVAAWYEPQMFFSVGNIDSLGNFYLPLAECHLAGYSSTVSAVNNKTAMLKQLTAVIGNVTACSNGDADKWRRLTLYACAAYFPPYPLVTPTQPCQSLCFGKHLHYIYIFLCCIFCSLH